MRRSWISIVLLALACDGRFGETRSLAPSPKPAFDLPAIPGGRLLAVWNWGEHIPDQDSALVVTDRSGSRELRFPRPMEARWLTRDAAVVSGGPIAEFTLGVLRVEPDESYEEWSRDFHLGFLLPSPDRRHAALHVQGEGVDPGTLEIRTLDRALRVVASRNERVRPVAWSPDGERLAVHYRTPIESHPHRFIFSRIGIFPRDLSSMHRLRDALGDAEEPPTGSLLLWWDRAGIWARVDGWVARCDPDAGGCTPLWKPPDPWFVTRGVPLGPHTVLLGVSHEERYASPEVRNRQLWRLDLRTGRAESIYQTPERVYLADFDWRADPPDASGAAPSP